VLCRVRVYECSPVLRPASGPGRSRTLSAKSHGHGDRYDHLPTELADAMRKAGGTLARLAWRDREEMQRIKMLLIRDQVQAAEYEAIRDELAAARYLWGF
jgi:hypothetical protein